MALKGLPFVPFNFRDERAEGTELRFQKGTREGGPFRS